MERTESPAPSCLSMKSDHSMDRPIKFKDGNFLPDISELPSSLLTEDQFRCTVCSDLLKDPVSIPCGHSYCRLCITTYWENTNGTGSYACPQCRKRSRTRPVLYTNSALTVLLQKIQQAGLSPAHPGRSYAEPRDVACDWCTGRKLKAVKSCLTCTASYCETHVRQHYTVPALQRHKLVEATEKLEQRLCQIHHRDLEVICKTEKIVICSLCAVEQHQGHDMICVKSEDSEKETTVSIKSTKDVETLNMDESLKKEKLDLQKRNSDLEEKNKALEKMAHNVLSELTYQTKHISGGCEEPSEVWVIDLSERKASLLLEVLKLQTDQRAVELEGWSEEESEVRSFLQCLPYISQLRAERNLTLRFLHCCTTAEDQQGATTALLQALQHKLDFSSSSAVDLSGQKGGNDLCLSAGDCRLIFSAVQLAQVTTELVLQDCEASDAALELLFPVLHKVRLRPSKPLLLQLLRLTGGLHEAEAARRAKSLCSALGEELDLSHTPVDLEACRALALVLEQSEGLSELDLSHCHLTDSCLELLLPHLHKVQVLDLSHNDITDHGAQGLQQVVCSNSSVQTVRLFSNKITDRRSFKTDNRFEIW